MNKDYSMSIYTLFHTGMVDVNFHSNLGFFCHKVTFWMLTEIFFFVRDILISSIKDRQSRT